MDRQAIYDILAEELLRIAPEAELDALDPTVDMREELDLDSLDYLNLVIAIGKRLGVQIPEADYGRISTLEALLAYLERATRDAGG